MNYFFRTLPRNSRLACWGAGPWLQALLQLMQQSRSDLRVVTIVDSTKSGRWNDLEIQPPDRLFQSPETWDYVLLCTSVNQNLQVRLLTAGIDPARIVSYPSSDYRPDATPNQQYTELERQGLAGYVDIEKQRLEARCELVRAVRYINAGRVSGDVIEFGTNTGHTASLLAAAMVAHDRLNLCDLRNLILVDSFAGLPEPTDIDRQASMVQHGLWASGSCCTLSDPAALKDQVVGLSGIRGDRVHPVKAWYRDLVPQSFPCTKAALIHLDCDLFTSTREALGFCLEHNIAAPGCIVLFDDWNCNAADPSLGQRAAWAELVQHHGISFSDEGPHSELGHTFILHAYHAAGR